MYNVYKLNSVDNIELRKHSMDLHILLTDTYS